MLREEKQAAGRRRELFRSQVPGDVGYPKGPRDPNTEVPLKGVIRGYIGIYGDYIGV